jgi:hypothetical protein
MKTQLLTVNSPNKNGRLYDGNMVREAMEAYLAKGKPVFVQTGFTQAAEINLENVCGLVEDIEVTDTEVLGTVKLFDKYMHLEGLAVRPSFIGKVDENGVVSDIELLSFNFTADPA